MLRFLGLPWLFPGCRTHGTRNKGNRPLRTSNRRRARRAAVILPAAVLSSLLSCIAASQIGCDAAGGGTIDVELMSDQCPPDAQPAPDTRAEEPG